MKKRIKRNILIAFVIIAVLILAAVVVSFLLKNPKPNVNDGRVYCPTGSENAQVCIEIYEPVCGYPAARTYSNSCVACSNAEVEYYFNGAC